MSLFSYYVGLDVHRKTVSYCVKRADGTITRENKIDSRRDTLIAWAKSFDAPWCCGLEATICSHWIYHLLRPYATEVRMGNPGKLKAVWQTKRKNDTFDARTLADLLRANLFPSCYVPPPEYEPLRAYLRERAFLVRARVMFKNKTAGLLIGHGVPYETRKLHQKQYYKNLLEENAAAIQNIDSLLEFNRAQIDRFEQMDDYLVRHLARDPLLEHRIEHLKSIRGVGDITALTWAVETGEPSRFPNERHAVSYCGLCAAQRESAGVQKRGPISKQRNVMLQTTLVEAAHMAILHNEKLRAVYDKERQRGPANRATLAVARHLVCWLLAADRQYFASLASATVAA